MKYSQVLSEGRIDDFISKYKNKFKPEDAKKIFLLSIDLSSNHKFLNFLGRVISPDSVNEDMMEAKIMVEKFIKYQQNLEEKDINQYNSLKDIRDAILKHENKIRREVKKVDGADIIYEDDRFTVVVPKTHKASCYYGSGSKWCTAALSSDLHFERYNETGKLFYFLDKKAKSGSQFYKVAMLQKYDGKQYLYDARDHTFNSGWILGTPEFEKINDIIQRYMQSEYAEDIEIFKDEVRAKQEMERRRIISDRIRRERLMAQVQDIRERDAWNPDTNELDDLGRKANAVMSGLRNEWLVGEIGEDEDIYLLMPETNNFYPGEILSFKWLGEIETDSEYIVGEWNDVHQLAKDRIRTLIDEMGVTETFNKDYLKNHLDVNKVVEYFKDYYDNYIRDDWEDIFTPDELPLSRKQEKRHEQLEQEIEELYRKTRDIETLPYSSDERNEIFEKIEELEEERDEIIENPEGEPTEEMFEEKVKEYLIGVRKYPNTYLEEHELEIDNFINIDSIIEDSIDTDGIGHNVSNYDGISYEIKIDGVEYYVFRVQ
jgi:hypothetical protein